MVRMFCFAVKGIWDIENKEDVVILEMFSEKNKRIKIIILHLTYGHAVPSRRIHITTIVCGKIIWKTWLRAL